MPLALTDAQLKQVMEAASLIAPALRDDFLRHLATKLGDAHGLSDPRLAYALCEVLGQRGVAVGRRFFGWQPSSRSKAGKPANDAGTAGGASA